MAMRELIELVENGYLDRLRLTRPESKMRAFKENGPHTFETLDQHLRRGFGLAMLLGDGLCVLDKDGPNQGPFSKVSSSLSSLTKRGTHEFFRTEIAGTNKIKATANGIKTDCDLLFNGIVCLPPAPTRQWKTPLIDINSIPFFPAKLLEETRKEASRIIPALSLPTVEAMRKWIRKVHAIEGQAGDKNTFRVACKIVSVVQDFDQALAEILAWNSEGYAQPPWDEKSLFWKIKSAFKYRSHT